MSRILKIMSLTTLLVTSLPFSTLAKPSQTVQSQSQQYELKQRKDQNRTPVGVSNNIVQPCADDEKLIMWDQPIYDDEGLFVIGHKKVPVCVEKDGEPAG